MEVATILAEKAAEAERAAKPKAEAQVQTKVGAASEWLNSRCNNVKCRVEATGGNSSRNCRVISSARGSRC